MFQSRGCKCMACDAVFCCPSHRRKHEIYRHDFVLPKQNVHSTGEVKANSPRNKRSTLIKSVLVEQTRKRSFVVNNILRNIENTENIDDRNILKAKRNNKRNENYGSASVKPVVKGETVQNNGSSEDHASVTRGRDDIKPETTPLTTDVAKTNLTPLVTSPSIGDGGFTTSTPLNDQDRENQGPLSNPCDTPATTHPTGKMTAIINPTFSRFPPTPLQSSGQKRKLSMTNEYFTALDELPSLSSNSLQTTSARKPRYARVFSRITSFVRNIFHFDPKDEPEISWAVPRSPSRRKKAKMYLTVRGRKSYRSDVRT